MGFLPVYYCYRYPAKDKAKETSMTREKRVRMLTNWIQDKVLGAGCRGVVLGMSGGIDSSLLAVLCKKAFPDKTLGVIMPCYSLDEDKEHAEKVARQFDIPTKTVVLNAAFDSLIYVLPDFKPGPDTARLARANLKARLRMSTLDRLFYQVRRRRRGYPAAGQPGEERGQGAGPLPGNSPRHYP
jgi:hypothetical protein